MDYSVKINQQANFAEEKDVKGITFYAFQACEIIWNVW